MGNFPSLNEGICGALVLACGFVVRSKLVAGLFVGICAGF